MFKWNRRCAAGLLALSFLCAALSACAKHPVKPSQNGVGRAQISTGASANPAGETVETDESGETTAPTTPTTTNTTVGGTPSYTVESGSGKYVYSIPAPDRSGLSDLSDVNSLSRALFSDSGNATSWYPGKTERNLTTGEVTYKWDRAKDTLALLDKYGAIYRRHTDQNVVYFTFDCGYENGWTEPILDVLKEKNVPGMFFLVGHYVDTADTVIRRMIDEGHLLGNHTNNHPDLTTVDAQTFIKELTDLEDKVKAKFPDAPPMRYMRPPEGACNEWSLAMAKKMDYTTVLWSWGHHDWVENDQPDPASALEKAKQGLHPGAVYLFHCVGSTNPAILGDLIDYIRAEGYEIHPLCD